MTRILDVIYRQIEDNPMKKFTFCLKRLMFGIFSRVQANKNKTLLIYIVKQKCNILRGQIRLPCYIKT